MQMRQRRRALRNKGLKHQLSHLKINNMSSEDMIEVAEDFSQAVSSSDSESGGPNVRDRDGSGRSGGGRDPAHRRYRAQSPANY